MDPSSARAFPHSLEAERALLGGILLDNDALGRALEFLTSDDFFREAHRQIYGAMVTLFQESKPIDIVILGDELARDHLLEEVGGRSYLSALMDAVPVTTNLTTYAQLIREKALLRRVLQACADISERVLAGEGEFQELLDFAERSIFAITEFKASQSFVHVSRVLEATLSHIEMLFNRKESVTGVPTGLDALDRMTAGLQPADLIIVAARPSMGKTAFALNICQHAAIRARVPVAIFSLEMSREQLVLRMLTSEAKVDASKVRIGQLNDEDWQRLVRGSEVLHDAPIFIDDTPGISIHELRAKARHLKREHDVGLIVIDYLQLMSGGRRDVSSREQEISEISRGLKGLAKELHVPVIALSQLNRSLENRTDKRPLMSDLRESGAIEQDADVILFIYREVVYRRKDIDELDEETKRRAELIIGKQRNGPTGTVNAVFLGEFSTFANPAEEYRDGI